MFEIFLRHKVRLLAVTVVACLVGVGAVQGSRHLPAATPKAETTSAAAPADDVVVDIEGAVSTPGVRHVPKGSLIEYAISQAGGLTDQADQAKVAQSINRSDAVKDHQKIFIPAIGEPVAGVSAPDASTSVNINSATSAELDTLPGIGPGTAKKIIDYRTKNGPFAAPEDLQNVPGITAKKFDALKDLVAV